MSAIGTVTVTRIINYPAPIVEASEPITRFGVDGLSVRLTGKRPGQTTITAVVFTTLAGSATLYTSVANMVGTLQTISNTDVGESYSMIITGISPKKLSTAIKPGTQITTRLEFDVTGYKQ